MKIPKYVIDDMHRAAHHFAAGGEIMSRVDYWFETNGFNMEQLRNGDGRSLEELEYGNDVTDLIIQKLKEAEE